MGQKSGCDVKNGGTSGYRCLTDCESQTSALVTFTDFEFLPIGDSTGIDALTQQLSIINYHLY